MNIANNELTAGPDRAYGIDINGSATITVVYNNISFNLDAGVFLDNYEAGYGGIIIVNNSITHNNKGIGIVTHTTTGDTATVADNTIAYNTYAVYHYKIGNADCSAHDFHHNNFIDNTYNNITFRGTPKAHDWYDDYPLGGNYWDDHTGADAACGPYQNETGSDGIIDASYSMGQGNTDRYPFKDSVYVGSVNLTVEAEYLSTELNVSVWIDNGDTLYSPVHVTVSRDQHEVEVDPWFVVWIDEWSYYKYTFDHWEDSSKNNPRNVWVCINKNFTAYYTRRLMGIGK